MKTQIFPIPSFRALFFRPWQSHIILLAFLVNSFGPMPAYAQADKFTLPAPGVMVHLSPPFDPPILKGIKVHPDNPFRFDFILDQGDSLPLVGRVREGDLKQEATKLIKYFLASLTIPEKDLWVNLSPYEKDRIIPQSFGLTEMGRDLLAEDYMLKQITASLIYPEDEVGKKFWKRIYEEAAKKYGTTNIPVNTFNKVWIVPEKAVVYENASAEGGSAFGGKAATAYVVESKLKVMLEQDYLALEKHLGNSPPLAGGVRGGGINALGSQIVREIVIPELTKEVNKDKNFAKLRQVYNSLILATWYKKKIKDSILSQVYVDKDKTAGVQYTSTVIPAPDKNIRGQAPAGIQFRNDVEGLYQEYLKAFKKGVYNYIKEEVDPISQQMIPRKYFSGGVQLQLQFGESLDSAMTTTQIVPQNDGENLSLVSVRFDAAMNSGGEIKPTDKALVALNDEINNLTRKIEEYLQGLSGPLSRAEEVIKQKEIENEQIGSLIETKLSKISDNDSQLIRENKKPWYVRMLPKNRSMKDIILNDQKRLIAELEALKVNSKKNKDILYETKNTLGRLQWRAEIDFYRDIYQLDNIMRDLNWGITDGRLYAEFNEQLINQYLMPGLEELRSEGKMTQDQMNEYLELVREQLKDTVEASYRREDMGGPGEEEDRIRLRSRKRLDRLNEIAGETEDYYKVKAFSTINLEHGLQDYAYETIIRLLSHYHRTKFAQTLSTLIGQYNLSKKIQDDLNRIITQYQNEHRRRRINDSQMYTQDIFQMDEATSRYFLHHDVQQRWDIVKNHPLIQRVFGKQTFNDLEHDLIKISLRRLLETENHTDESVSLGYRLFWLAKENSALRIELAPFLIMNAWREPGYSGESPFLRSPYSSDQNEFYLFINSLTADEIEQLRKKNIPGLMKIIGTVLHHPKTYLSYMSENPYSYVKNPVYAAVQEALGEMSLYMLRSGDEAKQFFVMGLLERLYGVDLTDEGYSILRNILIHSKNRKLQEAVLRMTTGKTGHEERGDYKAVLVPFQSFQQAEPWLQEEIRKNAPTLFHGFLGRDNLTSEHIKLLAQVLDEEPSKVEKTINFINGIDEEINKMENRSPGDFYTLNNSGEYDLQSYISLAQQEGILEMIRNLSGYGYQPSINHFQVLPKMVEQKEDLVKTIKEIRSIFPYFQYKLPYEFAWDAQAQQSEQRFEFDPYVIFLQQLVKMEGELPLQPEFMDRVIEIAELVFSNHKENMDSVFASFEKIMEQGIALSRQHPIFDRYKALIAAGFFPMPIFFDQYADYSIGRLSKEAERVRKGGMDINNDLDVALNYSNLKMDIAHDVRDITYKEFYDVIERIRNGDNKFKEELSNIDESHRIQVRGLVYEAYLIWKEILAVQEQARQSGRPVVVVENLSYGAVAMSPITVTRRNGNKYIIGTEIPVISTKSASSDFHHKEFILIEDLFTDDQIKQFLTDKPIVFVVDGSTSVNDPNRTSPHIPDGFKGFRNYFMALNKAIDGQVNPEDFYEDEDFSRALEQKNNFIRLTDKLMNTMDAIGQAQSGSYKFRFWYPGNKDLYLRIDKQKDMVAPNIRKVDNPLEGPTVIFVQSGMELEAVPKDIQSEFIRGQHAPVFFDDKDNYKQFYLGYEDGYGIVPSRAYVDLSRAEFKNLLSLLKEEVPQKTLQEDDLSVALPSNREVDDLILDLDGTIAPLGEAPSAVMVNRLLSLLKKGKKIVLVTDALEGEVDGRLRDFIARTPPESRPDIFIFANSATTGYTFNTQGEKVYLTAHNRNSPMDDSTQIENIINQHFSGLVYQEISPERLVPGLRMELRVKEGTSRTKIISQLQELLDHNGIDAKVYKTRSQGIRIVRQHKENAVEYFLETQGTREERVLIMADSAKTDQMDRKLLSKFKRSISINVGRRSDSLSRLNPNVVQLSPKNRGVSGVQRILDILDQRGNVPDTMLIASTPALRDAAMLGKAPGGIDLTPSKMNLQTKMDSRFSAKGGSASGGRGNDNEGIKFHLDPAMLQQLKNAPGFVPVIISVQPLKDLSAFLGLNQEPIESR